MEQQEWIDGTFEETDTDYTIAGMNILYIMANTFTKDNRRFNHSVGFNKISYTDDTNVTVDFRTGNKAELDMAGGSISGTLSLKFPTESGNFLLVVKQDGSTRTIAAFATLDAAGSAGDNDGGTGGAIRWAGGSVPNLTDGNNKDDILTFYWDADLEVCYGVATLNF